MLFLKKSIIVIMSSRLLSSLPPPPPSQAVSLPRSVITLPTPTSSSTWLETTSSSPVRTKSVDTDSI